MAAANNNQGISRAVLFLVLAAVMIWLATRSNLQRALNFVGIDTEFDREISLKSLIFGARDPNAAAGSDMSAGSYEPPAYGRDYRGQ